MDWATRYAVRTRTVLEGKWFRRRGTERRQPHIRHRDAWREPGRRGPDGVANGDVARGRSRASKIPQEQPQDWYSRRDQHTVSHRIRDHGRSPDAGLPGTRCRYPMPDIRCPISDSRNARLAHPVTPGSRRRIMRAVMWGPSWYDIAAAGIESGPAAVVRARRGDPPHGRGGCARRWESSTIGTGAPCTRSAAASSPMRRMPRMSCRRSFHRRGDRPAVTMHNGPRSEGGC